MTFYADMAATALALLAEFGTTVTLPRTTGGSTDPVTGEVITGTDATVTTTGLIKPYPDRMIDGTRILQGDRELVLSNEQEPLPTDHPTIGGENWAIVGIRTVKPDGATPVVYFLQVRK
jgi:hypothetical protein